MMDRLHQCQDFHQDPLGHKVLAANMPKVMTYKDARMTTMPMLTLKLMLMLLTLLQY